MPALLLEIGLAGVVKNATRRATELPDGFPATTLDSALVSTGPQLSQSSEYAFPRLVMSVRFPEGLGQSVDTSRFVRLASARPATKPLRPAKITS